MEKVMNLTYSSSLTQFCELNPSFDMGRLRIAYHGKNRNGSKISKESFERAVPTMFNCPVVCRYDRDTDSIGSHDIKLVKDHDDPSCYRIVNVTTPVGVVPESAKWSWETVTEKDGTSNEYLSTEVLLWKRQEAYDKILKDGIEAQSMEIEVKNGWTDEEDGSYVIDDFTFTAFCLLGEDTEPCFESADVEVYSNNMASFKERMSEMMADLRETYSMINSPNPEVEIKNDLTEGGENLDEKLALVEEYGLTVDELDFALDDFSLEELREKFEAMAAENNSEESTEAVEDTAAEETAEETFALESEVRDGLFEAVRGLGTIDMPWGQEDRYWFVDYDPAVGEVYAECVEDWKLYGFSYSVSGDAVAIDETTRKRMKWVVAPFDEGNDNEPFAGAFSRIANRYAKNESDWSEKFQNASNTIQSMNSELESLREFRRNTEEAEAKSAREDLFKRFEELDGIEAFEALKDNADQYDLEALEEKCFAIRGREGIKQNFAKDKQPKIKVTDPASTKEPYGGVFVKYGIAN